MRKEKAGVESSGSCRSYLRNEARGRDWGGAYHCEEGEGADHPEGEVKHGVGDGMGQQQSRPGVMGAAHEGGKGREKTPPTGTKLG